MLFDLLVDKDNRFACIHCGHYLDQRISVHGQMLTEVTARAIRRMTLVKSLVERCGQAVGWQRLLYRLRLLIVPQVEARKISQPLRKAATACL